MSPRRTAEAPPAEVAAGAPAGVPRIVVAPPRSPFLPLVLLGSAVVFWMGVQAYTLLREWANLGSTVRTQQAQVEMAARIRTNLNGLAVGTRRLSDGGNQNARLVVDALRQRGITVSDSGLVQGGTPISSRIP